MKRKLGTHLAILAVLLTPMVANAVIIELLATDTASPRVNLGGIDVNGHNRLAAYDTGGIEIDGFIRFDLSLVPDDATINSISLTLFSEGAFNAPLGSPEIQIRRSAFDGWSRGGSGFPITYDETLSSVHSGFSSTRHDAHVFALDVGAVDWTTDLSDNLLSLVLDEVSASGNDYMYFFGSDSVSATGNATSSGSFIDWVPKLTVDYSAASVNEPGILSLLVLGLLGIGGASRRRKA
jgi:hypothetical protein